jgi:hypothetical protein
MDYRVHTATQVVRQLWPLGECAGTTVPMSLMMHDDRDERQLDGNGKIHQRSRNKRESNYCSETRAFLPSAHLWSFKLL